MRIDPNTRSTSDAARANSVVGDRADHALFQCVNVIAQADTHSLQVENRIANQLSGAVECDVASAINVKERCALFGKPGRIDQQILRMAAFAQRVDRRMLDQQHGSAICGGAGPLARQQVVEQLLLQLPAFGILHAAEVTNGEFHRRTVSTLFRASSAKYDDRTSGALAQ